jgi:hypothetical protein
MEFILPNLCRLKLKQLNGCTNELAHFRDKRCTLVTKSIWGHSNIVVVVGNSPIYVPVLVVL